MPLTPAALDDLARTLAVEPEPASAALPRLLSIWEITSWILPMAPEHLRRVLAANPALPQGSAGTEGGTRWFTPTDVATLRGHFTRVSLRNRQLSPRPARAPLVALTGPPGGTGRTVATLHLATAAALAGWRVLVVDGDPAGTLARALRAGLADRGAGLLALIAGSAGHSLRRLNESRLDRGEPPVAMDDTLGAALTLQAADLIRPSAWPGLDVLGAGPGLMQADLRIGAWRLAQRSWRPWRALAVALEDLRPRYDLILCDTPRGLGPLALSVLASADVLLAPLPLRQDGRAAVAAGLGDLAQAMTSLQDEEQGHARALGQTAPPYDWQRLLILPTRAGPDAAQRLAGFAAKPVDAVLSAALPEVPQVAGGAAAQFYDLDYRDLGRLAYAPLREACDAAWRGLAASLTAPVAPR